MNKDQVKGDIKQANGAVKEAAGKLLGDKKLEGKGRIENATGKLQASYGQVRTDLKK